jgi:uncharacterized tellurite resistance protein B-like protein
MSALDLLKKVKVQTLSFEKHPCRDLDQEIMVHYLNGLALITNEDEGVCEKEREYLSILINSFGLSEETLETFVNFAENPDEKRILDMMQAFATKDIKYNFMIDAMMIASIDDNFDESEKAILEQYFEMFKITKDEEKDLRYLYEMFYTQNGNALYRYFKKEDKNKPYKIKEELFKYLLDYYKIDMAYELKEDEKKILTFEFFKPTFEEGSLGDGATEIMTKPVNNAQFCIYLNSAFMDKTIEIDGNGKVVDSKSKDLLMDLDNSDIILKDNEFLVSSADDEEKKITGVTYVMAEMFIEWVSEFNDVEYGLSAFDGYGNESYGLVDFNSFENIPDYEFIRIYNSSYQGISRLNKASNEGYSYMYYKGSTNNRTLSIDNLFNDYVSSFRMVKVVEEN